MRRTPKAPKASNVPLIPGPVRTCIGCGAKKAQGELLRVAMEPGGGVAVDRKSRQPGRGAYLCGAGCLSAALKRKAFGRAFRGKAGPLDPLVLERALGLGAAAGSGR
ncbi:YlxR family protein [Aggregicoccus sp. 17bor-14]|nr:MULTISPECIES: YlxR family protein [Myxococcaceae]MBF5044477.1 YlxR family protein [Simulacricoccus sp. 17bor-14]MRI90222.1 YlxR family protein [Aggregicoccus sp. 17bor-14]